MRPFMREMREPGCLIPCCDDSLMRGYFTSNGYDNIIILLGLYILGLLDALSDNNGILLLVMQQTSPDGDALMYTLKGSAC